MFPALLQQLPLSSPLFPLPPSPSTLLSSRLSSLTSQVRVFRDDHLVAEMKDVFEYLPDADLRKDHSTYLGIALRIRLR